MRESDSIAELGLSGPRDLERLRTENIELRGLVVYLSKLVLVNVTSMKGRYSASPVRPAIPEPATSRNGNARDTSTRSKAESKE
jgi:hypothetical protein